MRHQKGLKPLGVRFIAMVISFPQKVSWGFATSLQNISFKNPQVHIAEKVNKILIDVAHAVFVSKIPVFALFLQYPNFLTKRVQK